MIANDIYTTFNKSLYRETTDVTFQSNSNDIDPSIISTGTSVGFQEVASGGLRQGKTGFNNTETGFILGIDNGLAKFYIGNTSNYLNWTGTKLVVSGDVVLGGTVRTVDDFSNLQSSINEVSADGGGSIYIAPGTYTMTSNIDIPSNVYLIGASRSAVIFEAGSYSIRSIGTVGTHISNILIKDLTIQNSTSNGIYLQYVDVSEVTGIDSLNNLIGIYFDNTDSVAILGQGTLCDGNGTNLKITNSTSFSVYYSAFTNSTSSHGIVLDTCSSATIFDFASTGNTGDGINITSCSDISFLSLTVSSNGGQGIELVSGNAGLQFDKGTVGSNTSDGIKFTATSDNCSIGAGIRLTSNSGYGINIAAASCDNNIIVSPYFSGNASGTISNSGTGTVIIGDDTAYDATSWNGNMGVPTKNAVRDQFELKANASLNNLSALSMAINTSLISDTDNTDDLGSSTAFWKTGYFKTSIELGATDTTITRVSAGVVAVEGKTLVNLTDGGTFLADISVPDEAYGSGWNGSTEVPTKNAVYDKIETLSGASYDYLPNTEPTHSSYYTYQVMPVVDATANEIRNGFTETNATLSATQGGGGHLTFSATADALISTILPGKGSQGNFRFADIGANEIRIKFRHKFGAVDSNERMAIGVSEGGNAIYAAETSTAVDSVRFVVAESSGDKLYAVTSKASTTSNTNTDITGALTLTNWNIYEMVITSTSVKFYVNGTLAATHTTSIPTGTNNITLGWGIEHDAGTLEMDIAPTTITLPTS